MGRSALLPELLHKALAPGEAAPSARAAAPERSAPGGQSGHGRSDRSGQEAAALRVLVASHSHPRLSRGGAEIAAYQLYARLRDSAGYDAHFLGCVRDQMNQTLGTTISQPFGEREYLYATGAFDRFRLSNLDTDFPRELRQLLEGLQPDIVHFHHYVNFGIEAFHLVREALPDSRIVLTLHDYAALCHHGGQMVTKPGRSLCYESEPLRCSGCFKDITPSDFFLRKLYIQRFFDLVDHFVAPSVFLAERYAAWGIAEERITVIENLIPPPTLGQPGAARYEAGKQFRVGFFGQVSRSKGIDVLLDAAAILEERGAMEVVVEIHGDHREQPQEFQTEFAVRVAKAGRNVRFHGPYDQSRADQLMQAVDVVVVPSVWWENSPVVIQEALRNRCPIVCSDIGGMAEKVRDGVDGVHFPAGNASALAALLLSLATTPKTLSNLRTTLQLPPTDEQVVADHTQLYEALL